MSMPIPRHQAGELFLMGPIPMDWLKRASRCGGKALDIGIAIWHLAFLKRSGSVSVSISRVSRERGFNRTTGLRALQSLERSGLVTAFRTPGRSPQVTLHWPVATSTGDNGSQLFVSE